MVEFSGDLALLTPATCRAGRALVDWTQEELAERAGVGRSTIRDFEKGRHALHRSTERSILRTLRDAGVVVLPTGVMLEGRDGVAGERAPEGSPEGS
jgi:transcriptional regulator with XRE-family HTH domain